MPRSGPLVGQGVGRSPNSTFSEYGHVAYQIKGNDACSNMVANILSVDTTSTPGVGSKGQNIFFSESSQSKNGGKDQETIQSSTTLDPGYHMGK